MTSSSQQPPLLVGHLQECDPAKFWLGCQPVKAGTQCETSGVCSETVDGVSNCVVGRRPAASMRSSQLLPPSSLT
jgi:hypothetical protein